MSYEKHFKEKINTQIFFKFPNNNIIILLVFRKLFQITRKLFQITQYKKILKKKSFHLWP